MPYSSGQGKELFKEWLFNFMYLGEVKRILDVGAGAGEYGITSLRIINDVKTHKGEDAYVLDAVEIFETYINRFNLKRTYDHVYQADIRTDIDNLEDYDLIILGDVLEHVSFDEAKILFAKLRKKSKFIWLSIPCKVEGREWSIGYQQGSHEWEENISERHLHEWTMVELETELGPFLWKVPFPVVAVMIAEGDK